MKTLIPIASRFFLTQGALQDCAVAHLLPGLFWNEMSGSLEVENPQGALDREIIFEKGLPVQVLTYRNNESVGHFLVDQGYLSEDQYKDLIDLMLDQSLSIREALAQKDFLHPQELAMALTAHQHKVFKAILSEENGTFHFRPKGPQDTPPTDLGPSLDLGPLYAQCLPEPLDPEFLKMFSDLSIVLHEAFDVHMQSLGFLPAAIENILAKSHSQLESEDWRLILTALDFQLLSIALPEPANYSFAIGIRRYNAAADMQGNSTSRAQIILKHWLKVHEALDPQVLQVEVGASPKEVKAAYFKMVKTFHPDRYRGKVGDAVMDYCEHFFHRLTVSFERLSDHKTPTADEKSLKKEPWMVAEAYALLADEMAMQKNLRHALLCADAAQRCFSENARSRLLHHLANYLLAEPENLETERENFKKHISTFLSKQRRDRFWLAMAAALLVDEGQTQAGVRDLEALLGDFPNERFLMDLLKTAVASFTNPGLSVTRTFFIPIAS